MKCFGLLMLLALAGCAGPVLKTTPVPEVTPPSSWSAQTTGAQIGSQDWWTGFGDQTLDRLVADTLATNTEIGIAVGRVREARAHAKLASAALFPNIEVGAGGANSRTVSAFGKPLEQTAAQPQFQIAYEVDLFGRIGDERKAADQGYIASLAARDAVRLMVASTAVSGYVNLRALDARLDVAKQTLVARDEARRLARSRTQAGYAPMLELRQAEAEYQATARIIPQVEFAIRRQENALRLLAGQLPGSIDRGKPLAELQLVDVAPGLPSELIRRRPDIAEAEYRLAATDANLAAARKRFLPQMRLSGSAGFAISTLLSDPISLFSLGGSILAPIFEGGRLQAQAEGAAARRDQAAFVYRRAVLNGFREVEDALAGVSLIDAQKAIATEQVHQLGETYRLATNRYRAGYAPYLEQLDAQRGLLTAQLGLIDDTSAALTSRIQLFAALGGGWSEAGLVGD
ncbi:efflux transporter outer membrane subunit [Aquisediminimonas profunda]|uniref:efflux transporter outer membrane subunit n=1 Tax=Aquisediminimonas profunda TaxID=1550733 RepID=UPI001C637DFB|nr:efflux transporter outer membrane subunit [Aquisediminimonas profunda]